MRLPKCLMTTDDTQALAYLREYYGAPDRYTGARFDTWDPSGTRASSENVFTSDDLVAVSFLSVQIPSGLAIDLVDDRRAEFSDMLRAIGPDRDLVDEEEPVTDHPGYALIEALKTYPDVGPTTASKLMARKRPRLRPIYDSVVARVLDGEQVFWEPMRLMLKENDHALHKRLLELRKDAGLPDPISAIRVLDVIAWMEGRTSSNQKGQSAAGS